jgi:hypothetical protein
VTNDRFSRKNRRKLHKIETLKTQKFQLQRYWLVGMETFFASKRGYERNLQIRKKSLALRFSGCYYIEALA